MTKPVYSFSRLNAWHSCKLAFKYKYVDELKGEDNWFSRFGTLAHLIFEKVDRGELSAENAWKFWVENYAQMVLLGGSHELPWMIKWYDEASNFFFSFKGWRTAPKWIEQYIEVDRGNYILRGYVDRMSENGNGLSIQDYKSSKPYAGDDLKAKARQMYLYSEACSEKEGQYPKTLIFFHFRAGSAVIIKFDETAHREAWEWADSTVREIEVAVADDAAEYPPTVSPFFCKNICDFRKICPHI